MKVRWEFYFECRDFRFERVYNFEGALNKNEVSASGSPYEEIKFLMTFELDAEAKYPGVEQTGKLKIILSGNREQTKDYAYWIALNATDHISFTHQGELKLLGGFVSGEHLPETAEEIEKIGDKPFFWEMRVIEALPTPTFDSSSFKQIANDQAIRTLMRQYNVALRARNPIDEFLGLFKIIEDLFGASSGKKKLADVLKNSKELFQITSSYFVTEEEGEDKELTQEGYSHIIEKLVKTRNSCAHLRSWDGYGISHGDPRVESEVRPFVEPLSKITFDAIRNKM